jgi:hypothetical protein
MKAKATKGEVIHIKSVKAVRHECPDIGALIVWNPLMSLPTWQATRRDEPQQTPFNQQTY